VSLSGNVLVVGLGSSHGDDQAGWFVAETLASQFSGVEGVVVRRATVPLDLLDWLDHVDALHICDACENSGEPDGLHRLIWSNGHDLNSSGTVCSQTDRREKGIRRPGSHDYGLPDVLKLAGITNRLPRDVIIWAVEGCCFEPGETMRPETRAMAMKAVTAILEELKGPAKC
jgi:hydrogenase maturation protease